MGLFVNVIHIADSDPRSIEGALHRIGARAGLELASRTRLAADGPGTALRAASSRSLFTYLVVPSQGRWTAVIETDFRSGGVPRTAALALAMSAFLGTAVLTLIIHDDDVLFYDLSRNGNDLDGYNSNPQYFESKRLSDDYIESQRHRPAPFLDLLPTGVSFQQLNAVLDRGWWSAYDRRTLDRDGLPVDDGGFIFESQRAVAIGKLLKLHRSEGQYPYAHWRDSKDIHWPDVIALSYSGGQ